MHSEMLCIRKIRVCSITNQQLSESDMFDIFRFFFVFCIFCYFKCFISGDSVFAGRKEVEII